VPASKCTSLLKNERYTHDLRNVFLFVLPMVVKAVDMLRHSNVLPISVCYFEVAKRFLGLIMVANHEENIMINFTLRMQRSSRVFAHACVVKRFYATLPRRFLSPFNSRLKR